MSFSAHWILAQYPGDVWEQIVVSLAGIAVMVAVAWALDWASEVPDLFVKVVDSEETETPRDLAKVTETKAATVAG